MGEVSQAAQAHPYVAAPSGGRVCNWIGGAILGAKGPGGRAKGLGSTPRRSPGGHALGAWGIRACRVGARRCWAPSLNPGAIVGLFCVNPDGGNYEDWLPQVWGPGPHQGSGGGSIRRCRTQGCSYQALGPSCLQARQACSQAGMQPGRHAARQACSQAGMQPGRHACQAGMQPGRHACRPCRRGARQACSPAGMQPGRHAARQAIIALTRMWRAPQVESLVARWQPQFQGIGAALSLQRGGGGAYWLQVDIDPSRPGEGGQFVGVMGGISASSACWCTVWVAGRAALTCS
jgi:hypothetical protein